MSAFQVSPAHIGAILRWYLFDLGPAEWRPRWRDHQPTREDAIDMAAALAFECYRSVRYRYPDGELPGPVAFEDSPVVVDVSNLGVYKQLSAVGVIKACHCLEYQSCEHPEWQSSEAKRLLTDISNTAIGRLPGYEAAAWHIDDLEPTPTYSLLDLTSATFAERQPRRGQS